MAKDQIGKLHWKVLVITMRTQTVNYGKPIATDVQIITAYG